MKIGIVGLGYVGLPLAVAFCEAGHDVIGVDTDARVVEALSSGRSHVEDVPDESLRAIGERFHADHPLRGPREGRRDRRRRADARSRATASRTSAADRVRDRACRGAPGWASSWSSSRRPTRAPRATSSCRSSRSPGLPQGATSTRPSRPSGSTRAAPTTPCATRRRSWAGLPTSACERASSSTARSATTSCEVSTPEAAELTKLLENVFRSVNIALVNELAILCDRMGIDIWEVVEAAATKPYGFMSFKPGPGHGRHCLPVDPFYLAWRAREFDMQTEFIELAGEVNQRMPYFCVERIARALNDHVEAGARLAGRRSSASPTSPASGDLRESPGAEDHAAAARAGRRARLPRRLRARAARARPALGRGPRMRDCAVIVTAHPGLDLERVVREAPLVVDFRGVTRGIEAPNLVRL